MAFDLLQNIVLVLWQSSVQDLSTRPCESMKNLAFAEFDRRESLRRFW